MKILDVGCGNNKAAGAVGIDINPLSCADVIHDLSIFPWPFRDNEFSKIICSNVLEHVNDFVKTIEEIYRISENGAVLEITGPFPSSVLLYTDPTHRRAFVSRSLNCFLEKSDLYTKGFSAARFELLEVEYERNTTRYRWLDKKILGLANRFKNIYESRFMYIYPVNNIYFKLKIVK